jgi:uncharacterized protein YjiS (DUF1127 family)
MFDTLKQRFADWRDFRRTVSKLGALDDYLLADVGYDRSMIRSCVKEELAARRAH